MAQIHTDNSIISEAAFQLAGDAGSDLAEPVTIIATRDTATVTVNGETCTVAISVWRNTLRDALREVMGEGFAFIDHTR